MGYLTRNGPYWTKILVFTHELVGSTILKGGLAIGGPGATALNFSSLVWPLEVCVVMCISALVVWYLVASHPGLKVFPQTGTVCGGSNLRVAFL